MFMVSSSILKVIVTHIQAAYPDEACGLLGGNDGQAWTAQPIRNVSGTPRVRYEMDPEQLVETLSGYEAQDWDMVAIYHSHPAGPPHPSASDIAESHYPQAIYIIIDLTTRTIPALSAWQIRDGQAHPVQWMID